MRQLREILRLKQEVGLAHREIAAACGIASSTVSLYLERAAAAGLQWPVPADLDDGALEARLFTRAFRVPGAMRRSIPDAALLQQELSKRGVTLQLLWQEYRAAHPQGYSYSQFCEHYRRWVRRLKPSMRQVHRAGEKVFVDFAGQKAHVVNPETGEVTPVEIFVGVLGASGLLYAEATRGQDLGSWVAAHVRMLEAYQGCPAIWVPDNLRSAVTSPHRYEPTINRTYSELAQHYGAVVIPARIRRPRDKALAELGVLLAERWVLAALRHRTFFSLADLNAAIRERVQAINARPMKRVGVSRQALYERLDRPALRPLPTTPFELAEWKLCRVAPFCGARRYVASRLSRCESRRWSPPGGHIKRRLQRPEKCHQAFVVAPAPAARRCLHFAQLKGFGLHLDVYVCVDVGGVQAYVTEPGPDRIDVDARPEKVRRRGVANHMGAHTLVRQRGRSRRGPAHVTLNQRVDSESGQRGPTAVEEDVLSRASPVGQAAQFRDGL